MECRSYSELLLDRFVLPRSNEWNESPTSSRSLFQSSSLVWRNRTCHGVFQHILRSEPCHGYVLSIVSCANFHLDCSFASDGDKYSLFVLNSCFLHFFTGASSSSSSTGMKFPLEVTGPPPSPATTDRSHSVVGGAAAARSKGNRGRNTANDQQEQHRHPPSSVGSREGGDSGAGQLDFRYYHFLFTNTS